MPGAYEKLFPIREFNTTELNEIAEALSKPIVKAYLKNQAILAFQGIARGLPRDGESAEEYIRRQATVVGSIAVIEEMLLIEPATSSNPGN